MNPRKKFSYGGFIFLKIYINGRDLAFFFLPSVRVFQCLFHVISDFGNFSADRIGNLAVIRVRL